MAGRRLLYRRTWLQRLNPGGGAENRQNEKLWISFVYSLGLHYLCRRKLSINPVEKFGCLQPH